MCLHSPSGCQGVPQWASHWSLCRFVLLWKFFRQMTLKHLEQKVLCSLFSFFSFFSLYTVQLAVNVITSWPSPELWGPDYTGAKVRIGVIIHLSAICSSASGSIVSVINRNDIQPTVFFSENGMTSMVPIEYDCWEVKQDNESYKHKIFL